ncbi:hypothetical protein AQUCO_11000040v1, partial [Aquilegia coerulea]
MADALISIVLEQLALYVQHEVELLVSVREEVGKLASTLKIVQAVLLDAEEKQVKNKAVKIWLEELKDIVYAADDLLDEWQTRTLISQIQRVDEDVADGTRKKVLHFFLFPCCCVKNVIVRYDIGQRIKEIREHLDVNTQKKEQYDLTVIQRHDEPRQLTSSVIDVSEIRGRDHDKEIIMSRLMGESSRQAMTVRVVSIVGMAGFGKTTLAKLVFNEEEVVKSFEKRMWVCVSQPCDLSEVAKAIIEEAKGSVPDVHGWEALHHSLGNSIKGKQFLLVLDDVWSDDPSHWSPLKLSLEGGAPGSRILVTTRNEDVAKTMGSTHIHNLGELSAEDSWSLLREVALKGREEENEKFEKIGKDIAIKCKGVPLAIHTLASHLWHKRSKQDWRDVLASDLWEVTQIENSFLPALFMSYYSLPSSSKQCFIYCAIFPKDSKIFKDHLIKLWMSQGFLGSGGLKELEKIGGNYFDNLAMRSFFQDIEKDSDGNIISCKMHDLVHDFAQYLTQNECSILEDNDTRIDGNKIRHLCTNSFENHSIRDARNLRTLIRPIGCEVEARTIPIELFHQLACLRTLDLSGSALEELPNEVEKLLHLRYLDLSSTSLLELPETISNLYNLQTLKLNGCDSLGKLPKTIGNLSNLRHLEILDTDELVSLPRGIGRLSYLRTLSKFIVGMGCKVRDLKHLNNLQGNLEIMGLEEVADVNEVIEAELKKKRNLRALTVSFNILGGGNIEERERLEGVFEKLELHENLEGLTINCYQGSQFPFWMKNGSLLDNVVNMKIYKCEQCPELPALGRLASLETLVISGIQSVKHIGNDFCGFGVSSSSSAEITAFPKLKMLKIRDMAELEVWELPVAKDRKVMPQLCHLEVRDCTKLRALPPFEKLESLENLVLDGLTSVKLFFDTTSADIVAFPKLKKLKFHNMEEWKEWKFSISSDKKIMPCLHELKLYKCPMLRALPALGKLESLEILYIDRLSSVKQ